jgi:hypothetical protein
MQSLFDQATLIYCGDLMTNWHLLVVLECILMIIKSVHALTSHLLGSLTDISLRLEKVQTLETSNQYSGKLIVNAKGKEYRLLSSPYNLHVVIN